MPKDPYHDMPEFCNSGRKTFLECERAWLFGKRGLWKPDPTEPMDVGTYFHVLTFEPEKAAAWLAEHPQYCYKNTSKAYGYEKGDPKADFRHCHTMLAALERQPLAMERLEGVHEKPLFGTFNGVPVRCKVDAINHPWRLFSDLKSCAALDDTVWCDTQRLPWWRLVYSDHNPQMRRIHWIEAMQYHFQMAIYRDILRQNYEGFDTSEPAIVAVTKQDPPGVMVYRFVDEDKLGEALKDAYSTFEKMHRMLQEDDPSPVGCGVCDLCRIQPITRCMEV